MFERGQARSTERYLHTRRAATQAH